MPWQFCEIVKSRQTLECAVCGRPIPADENKVRIKPSKKHDEKFRYHYHRACFGSLLGPMMENLLRGVDWKD